MRLDILTGGVLVKTRLLVFLMAIAVPFFLFYYVNRARGDNQKLFDCTSWNAELPPQPIHFIENDVLSFESADFRVAGYRNPEREKQVCVRYFLESTGQILLQLWIDANDVPTSAVLFEDGYAVQSHMQVKWRFKNRRNLSLEFEIGIFTDREEFMKGRTFIVVLTRPKRITFF